MAHISLAPVVADFLAFQSWHTSWHTLGTHSLVSGTHEPRTTIRDPFFTNYGGQS